MNHKLILLILLLVALVHTGCAERPAGKYVNQDESYIELKADGTFYAHGNAGGIAGEYTVQGTEIMLKVTALGFAEKCTLQGDTLIKEDGQRFVKKASK
ncbi:MAG: hypothetical protein SFU53_06300 [Terrimicrobiaceae bacterium]|nr:hypothetical protein [Terrimicrobiaceae bacterium]